MLVHEQKVRIFIHLSITQSELFEEHRDELINLIDNTPDDVKSLSNNIMKWCEKNPDIDIAFASLSKKVTKERGSGSYELNEDIPDYKPYKETLKNSIQQSLSYDEKKRIEEEIKKEKKKENGI